VSNVDFHYLEHVSDAMAEAYGRTLSEVFANSAKALVNIVCDLSKIDPNKSVIVETEGFDQISLLYNWLEKVLLTLLVDNIALANFEVTIERSRDKYKLTSMCRGEAFSEQKHHYKVEVKAITYHEMKIFKRNDMFIVQFLVDL
jgi:SHS2 domain-containing protein